MHRLKSLLFYHLPQFMLLSNNMVDIVLFCKTSYLSSVYLESYFIWLGEGGGAENSSPAYEQTNSERRRDKLARTNKNKQRTSECQMLAVLNEATFATLMTKATNVALKYLCSNVYCHSTKLYFWGGKWRMSSGLKMKFT